VDDLKNMVKWFKIPYDPVLPTRRQELTRGTIIPDDAPTPADSIPALQALMNPITLDLASLTNLVVLGLASAIGPAVLVPAPVIDPTVAADIAPAATTGVNLSAAAATGKEKENKKNEQEMLDGVCLIVNDSDEEMSDDEFEMPDWV
jgi:hypothetical protein